MNYWLDLFTGTTWKEFRQAGARISGFRSTTKGIAKQVKPGDIFICYLTGVMRWVGALEVVGPSLDRTRIWQFDAFPVRFEVQPLVILDPEHGVPMADLEGKVAFFSAPSTEASSTGSSAAARTASSAQRMGRSCWTCFDGPRASRFFAP